MNYMQIALLALGLSMVSYNDFVADGFALKAVGGTRQFRYFIFSLSAILLFIVIGQLIGIACEKMVGKLNVPIAGTILIITGLKVMVEELLLPGIERGNPGSDIHTLVRITLIDGITPFVVAIAVGLLHADFLTPLVILMAVITLSAAIGMGVGFRKGGYKKRVNISAIGGVFILAAGLKMMITLLGM